MTTIYFVRHALPDNTISNDRMRPLLEEGINDSRKVTECLKDKPIDFILSSPYRRSMDTVKDLATTLHMEIHVDEDLREREQGEGYGPDAILYRQNMWNDFSYKLGSAESMKELQTRNIRAIQKVLREHKGETIVIATHGAALSSILKYYEPELQYEDFIRILNYVPYVVRLTFDGDAYLHRYDEFIIQKDYV